MNKLPYEEIVEKIVASSPSLTKGEVEGRIKLKMDQLSGLISKEGAAHIIANELEVKLFEVKESKLKIKDILPGLRDLEVDGKLIRSYGVREFKVQDRSGKVGSFLMGDDSGVIRVVMWGSLADELEKINEGDIVRIIGCYSKENNNYKELHMGDKATLIINPDGVNKEDFNNVVQKADSTRKKISDLTENDNNIEVMGTIVDLFDIRFFEVCSECSRRVKQDTDFKCDNHPDSNFTYSYVLNGFVDDGTGNIRFVLFRERIKEFFEMDEEKVLSLKDNLEEYFNLKTSKLGTIVKLRGRVVKNQLFDRLEFMVNSVDLKPDPKEELKEGNEL